MPQSVSTLIWLRFTVVEVVKMTRTGKRPTDVKVLQWVNCVSQSNDVPTTINASVWLNPSLMINCPASACQ
jgi:hypothetical protein